MNELIKALDAIKAECEKHCDCSDCPLGNASGECLICDSGFVPKDWDVYHPETSVIRLLS